MVRSDPLGPTSSRGTEIPVKHPVFWFDDGSIVFRAQNRLFKVHRTMLSRHSRFFAELQPGLPKCQPTALDLRAYQHPVVTLDRRVLAEDVEVLLGHLYHDTSPFHPLHSDTPFPRIAAALRISSPLQLDFPAVYKLAERKITSMFPCGPVPFFRPDNLREALALATEYQITPMRRVVYYSLVTSPDPDFAPESAHSPSKTVEESIPSRTSPSPVLSSEPNGPVKNNGMSILAAPASSNSDDHGRFLSQDDTARCTQLMTRLIDHFTPILFTPPATPHMACTDVFADKWMTRVIQPAIENGGVYKPLETLEQIKSVSWAKEGLCESCVKEKHEEWTEEQRIVWKSMDEWLG